MKSKLRGAFRPQCESDGSYTAIQCHGKWSFVFVSIFSTIPRLEIQTPLVWECLRDHGRTAKFDIFFNFYILSNHLIRFFFSVRGILLLRFPRHWWGSSWHTDECKRTTTKIMQTNTLVEFLILALFPFLKINLKVLNVRDWCLRVYKSGGWVLERGFMRVFRVLCLTATMKCKLQLKSH